MTRKRWAGWLVLACGGLFSESAFAQTYYLESEPNADRAVALEIARVAADQGVSGRVVRLYQRERGWVYLFRSPEVSDDDALRSKLTALAGTPAKVHLIESDNGQTKIVDVVAPTVARPGKPVVTPMPSGAPEPTSVDRALDAQEILRRVVRAHAGPVAGEGLSTAQVILFRYERQLPDQKVSHVYVKRGDDLYLQVDVEQGTAVPIKLGIVKGKAWVADQEGTVDAVRAREQIERFAPNRVLGVPFLFTGGLPGGREYELLAVGDTVKVYGRPAVILTWTGDRESAPMQLVVDTSTWRILEIARGEDDARVRWVFSDYVEMGDGRIHPGRVEVLQGTNVLDRVVIRELQLEPTLLDEWFPVR